MADKRLVYFENWIDPVAEDILRAAPGIELIRLSYDDPIEKNRAVMATAHGYQVSPGTEIRQPWRATKEFLANCPNLLAISVTGAGYDPVDDAECTRLGIAVCNQSGTNNLSVAEHALSLMLALAKRFGFFHNFMRREDAESRFGHPTSELFGKTVGIVGINAIGSTLAGMVTRAFDCTVLAYDPYLTAEQIAARGATKVELDELVRRSDYVSLHCPLNNETRGMIGAAQFAAMKPSAYFVTTARGGVHDEAALIAALRS
jgi:D-3-phosphoglycerate dehydrogenase